MRDIKMVDRVGTSAGTVTMQFGQPTGEDFLAMQKRQTMLQMISTGAIVIIAGIALYAAFTKK